MTIFPPLNKYSSKIWLTILAASTVGGLMWILHFVLEFSVINKTGVHRVLEITLDDHEQKSLKESASTLKKIIKEVEL